MVPGDEDSSRLDGNFNFAVMFAIMNSDWEMFIPAPSETPYSIVLLKCSPHLKEARAEMKCWIKYWQHLLMANVWFRIAAPWVHSDDVGDNFITSALVDSTVSVLESITMTRFDEALGETIVAESDLDVLDGICSSDSDSCEQEDC